MSRATNSFEHIRAIVEDTDAAQKTDRLRASIASSVEVLAAALNESLAYVPDAGRNGDYANLLC